MHLLGTHYASLAARICINSCTHMHNHVLHLCLCLHVLTLIAHCFESVMLCFKLFLLLFWTNLNLIKFCGLFCVFAHVFLFVLCVHVQMSSTKHSAPKRPTSKRARIDSDNFKSVEAVMAYNDRYKRATIIMERVVKLDTL